MKVSVFSQWLLIAVFVAALWLPLLDSLLGLDSTPSSTEKRLLVSRPEVPGDLESLKAFPAAFEAYYNDHFGFRNTLIFLNNYLLWQCFHDSTSNRVLVGQGNWLFYKGRRVIDYHRGIDPFTPDELEAWRKVFEERRDWLKSRGIEYAVFFAANKHSIYPEHLPGYLKPVKRGKRLDQLMAHMKAHSDVLLIDVRPALMEAKLDERLFHWTDSHWNDLGGYHAYREVMKRLADLDPAYRPLARVEYQHRVEETEGKDLANLIGLERVIHEVQHRLTPVKPRSIDKVKEGLHPPVRPRRAERLKPFAMVQADDRLPRAVFFRDSAFSNLVRFFAPHFSRSVYYWQYDFDPEVVEHEKPDLVIDEILERELMNLEPANPPEIQTP